MKGVWIDWSSISDFISQRRALPRRALLAQIVATYGRADISLSALNGYCKRMGWMTGRDGRFPPGLAPHNKGKPFTAARKSAATQFRKGNLPHNTKWLGHERVSKDGYVEISVAETNPHTGFPRRYVLKHLWLWEQAHGPLPPGQCLKCLDGDKTNTAPSNWEAIPRAMLPRLGGRYGRAFDAAPPELKPAILAVTKLEHAVRVRTRGEKAPKPRGRPPKACMETTHE